MDKKVLDYRVIIEPEKRENGETVFVAYCPTLGISDYGDTVEEVLSSMKDGIELAIEMMIKKKQVVPTDRLEEQIITSSRVFVPENFNNYIFASS